MGVENYRIVTGPVTEPDFLRLAVRNYISRGWVPQGGVSYDGAYLLMQAMIYITPQSPRLGTIGAEQADATS
jgi:hypothetical protein